MLDMGAPQTFHATHSLPQLVGKIHRNETMTPEMGLQRMPTYFSSGKEISTSRKRERGVAREGGRTLYFELISSFLPAMAREASSHVSVALCKQRCHGNTSCLSWHYSRPLNNISSTHKRTLCPLIKFAIMLMFTIQALLLALCLSRRPGDIFQEIFSSPSRELEGEADLFQRFLSKQLLLF